MIRKATESDLNSIYRLINELENAVFPENKFKEVFLQNLSDERIHYFVKSIDLEVIAFISLLESLPLHHCTKIVEVQELIVTEKHQNRAIGKELLDFIQQFALENNFSQIEIASNNKRVKAHNFYIRNGFPRSHFKFVKKIR
jgi:(aminoalkyl)phosphonate N-acetyltransferase